MGPTRWMGEENADKTLSELWGRSWYAYRYVGSTQGGLDVVHARHSGGGSGIFNRVVFTRTEMDRGVDYPLLREVESRTAAAQTRSPRSGVDTVRREDPAGRPVAGDGPRSWGMTWFFADAICTSDVSWAAPPRWRPVEMERFMEMDCKDGPAAHPTPARVYEAPGRAS